MIWMSKIPDPCEATIDHVGTMSPGLGSLEHLSINDEICSVAKGKDVKAEKLPQFVIYMTACNLGWIEVTACAIQLSNCCRYDHLTSHLLLVLRDKLHT